MYGKIKNDLKKELEEIRSAGLYKSEAPTWLAYGRWFSISVSAHRRHVQDSIRQMKLAKIRQRVAKLLIVKHIRPWAARGIEI